MKLSLIVHGVFPSTAILVAAMAAAMGGLSQTALGQDFGNHQLCLIRPDGTELRQITRQAHLRFGSPAISPDGKKIAADCAPARMTVQDTHIVVMDAEGDSARHFGPGSMPAWSPNGELIAFHTYSPRGIWVMNADDTGREEIANHWGSPRWSASGEHIVCLFDDSTLRVIDLRSGRESAISGPRLSAVYPGFGLSHDGKRIAYGDQAQSGLVLATIDGNWRVMEKTRHFQNSRCTFCSFSPDGERVVLSLQLALPRPMNDKPQLYILEVGSEGPPTRLKEQDQTAANVNPQWSPDGEWIIFTSDPPE